MSRVQMERALSFPSARKRFVFLRSQGLFRQPQPIGSPHTHHNALTQIIALRAGLEHHCVATGLDSDYYDHLQVDGPRLVLEYRSDDEHVAQLVPVAQAICQLIDATRPCSCVLATAHRLLNAMQVVSQKIKQGWFV